MTDPALSITTDHGRYYIHPGKQSQVPSITNIKDLLNKPGLKYWHAKECAAYASAERVKLATLSADEAFTLVKGAPFLRKENSPSRIGDIVHDWIDRYIKIELDTFTAELAAAPITARRMWEQFLKFKEHYNPQFIDSEFTVWSDKYGYAGTADIAMRLGKQTVLVDTKTGNRNYPETGMQLAALANADFIITPEGDEKPLPKFDAFAILHLRPMSFSLIPVYNLDEAFKAFLGLKATFDWQVEWADKTLGFAPRFGTGEKRAQ